MTPAGKLEASLGHRLALRPGGLFRVPKGPRKGKDFRKEFQGGAWLNSGKPLPQATIGAFEKARIEGLGGVWRGVRHPEQGKGQAQMSGRWTLEALVQELGVPRSTLKHRLAQLQLQPIARGARSKLYYDDEAKACLVQAGQWLKEGLDFPELRERLGLALRPAPAGAAELETSPAPQGRAEAEGQPSQEAPSLGPGAEAPLGVASGGELLRLAQAVEELAAQHGQLSAQLLAKDQHIQRLSEALARAQEQGAAQQAKAQLLHSELQRCQRELEEARRLMANGPGGSLLKRLWGQGGEG